MTATPKSLSSCIKVGRRYLRSVHLEKDYSVDREGGDYIVTPTAREVLHRIADGLEVNASCRAWTLTGPYGVGKSAFGVFLSQLLCARGQRWEKARALLRDADPALAQELSELPASDPTQKGMLPVLVTARRAPAPVCLAEGIASALAHCRSRKLKSLGKKLRDLSGPDGVPDSRRLIETLASATMAAKEVGLSGVLLIVDELGKLFEYAARDPQRGDVFVLQELAEHAARSEGTPFVFLGLLHQSFEEYGRHLDVATRREWAKIHGRFEDVSFIEPAEQIIRMIAKAIHWHASQIPQALSTRLRKLARVAVRCGAVPPGMKKRDFEEAARQAYPLHPLTLVALPYLFRRFAQNERSLFSYLSSREPGGFQEFIHANMLNADAPAFIRLESLFDYFTSNFGSGLYRHPHARRWMEASDALERRVELNALHRHLVKSIGMLNALGEFCHLSAQERVISCAIDDATSPRAATARALQELRERSLLTYRRFNDTYRIWEGSDVDIEERVAEGERRLRHSLGLAETVQQYLPTQPVVARRHSFETGAVRFFDLHYADSPDEVSYADVDERGADGQIMVCLSESAPVAEKFRGLALAAADRQEVLFAVPQQIGELRACAVELAALRWAWENTPGLRDDRVARRELALRITEAEQLLVRCLDGLLDPRPEPLGSGCLWFCGGHEQEVRTAACVSRLLSEVCDRLYPEGPRIRNELIARRALSSAAASARRNLVEAMLLRPDQPLLGMEGFPPERSMYESVLRATGLHGEGPGGTWGLSAPSKKKEHNLAPAWSFLCSRVFSDAAEPVHLDVLFQELARPPFGIMEGLHPVLLCAFMMVHRDETTLYREGTFIPEPGVADYEVLMRRPELFAVAGSRVTGGRASVVRRLAEGLNVPPATVPVVRALFHMVKGLPEFAWRTRELPARTLGLRGAFESAKSPERFLFVELPEALGLQGFTDRRVSRGRIEAFFDALNAGLQSWAGKTPAVIAEAEGELLAACGLPSGDSGWTSLRRLCLRVEQAITNTQLLAFVRRVIQATPDDTGVQSVLALVANCPPLMWSDSDVERFSAAAAAIGQAFRKACLTGTGGTRTYERLSKSERAEAEAIMQLIEVSPVVQESGRRKVLIAALEMLIEHLASEEGT